MALATTVESWQALITPYTGQSLTELLKEAKADYDVVLNHVYVYDPFKQCYTVLDNQFVTGRIVKTADRNILESWQVVKGRYSIVSNLSILQKAKLLSEKIDNAVLQGCGVLDEGRKFFCVVNTGSVEVLLAKQEKDVIDNHVVLMTSHDGSIPITYYNLDVRRTTSSVIRFTSSNSDFCLRKRHTPNEAELNVLKEIEEAVRLRNRWTSELQSTLRNLLVPISPFEVDQVLETVWSEKDAPSARIRENIKSLKTSIKTRLASPHNSGTYGVSKWALLNAASEYVDFGRNIAAREAAQHSLEIDNQSHRLKIKLHTALLKQ